MKNIEAALRPVYDELKTVMNLIKTEMYVGDKKINRVLQYVFDNPGKGLRPGLLILSAHAAGEDDVAGENMIKLAAAAELIHTASLLHDDIIDNSRTRRYEKTVKNKWGINTAMLLGDKIYSRAFILLSESSDASLRAILSGAAESMCDGELKQNAMRYDINISIKEYLNIIRKKTASLLAACCQTGAIKNRKLKGEMYEYGINFGMGYQIIDDCRDAIKENEKNDESLDNDIENGNITLPFIYFLEHESDIDSYEYLINRWESSSNLRNWAIKKSIKKANQYLSKACDDISELEESVYKDSLITICESFLNEDFRGPVTNFHQRSEIAN